MANLHNTFTNEDGVDAMAEHNKKIASDAYERSSSKKLTKRKGDTVKTWNGVKSMVTGLRNAYFAEHGPELVKGLPAAIGLTQDKNIERQFAQCRREGFAYERDHWKFKDRDETKNRSFVMSHDKIEPMIWDRF